MFLLGGMTRDEKAIPIVLRSGDVLIMSGPRCRRAFHGTPLIGTLGDCAQTRPGVPRILEGSLPNHLKSNADDGESWNLIANYMATTRININVRRVFPVGFPYEQHGLSHIKNIIS